MSHANRETTEIRVRRRGLFTTHHCFSISDRTLGELTLPAFGQGGIFRAEGGRDLVLRRPNWLSTEHEMCQEGRVRARARGSGLLSSAVTIEFGEQTYILKPAGVLSEKWRLLDSQDLVLLSVEPQGFAGTVVRIRLQPGVDRDLVVFAYYLVHMRREETAAACAAVG